MRGVITIATGATALIAGTRLVRLRRDADPLPQTHGDAILVFGAAVWPTGPSHALRARGEHAARLYRQGLAPVVVCGGTPVETDALRTILRGAGVPGHAIVSDLARSTRETIWTTARRAAGEWSCVLAVSSRDHMHRVLAEARRQGLPAIGCPVPRANGSPASPFTARLLLHRLRRHAYEIAAIGWYAITARSVRP